MFGPEYPKIQTVFKRDERKLIVPGDWTSDEFRYLADCEWRWTEKVDGTNIRVHWNGDQITIGGRTDNAQVPTFLLAALQLQGLTLPEKWAEVFPDSDDVTVYGEGYESPAAVPTGEPVTLHDLESAPQISGGHEPVAVGHLVHLEGRQYVNAANQIGSTTRLPIHARDVRAHRELAYVDQNRCLGQGDELFICQLGPRLGPFCFDLLAIATHPAAPRPAAAGASGAPRQGPGRSPSRHPASDASSARARRSAGTWSGGTRRTSGPLHRSVLASPLRRSLAGLRPASCGHATTVASSARQKMLDIVPTSGHDVGVGNRKPGGSLAKAAGLMNPGGSS